MTNGTVPIETEDVRGAVILAMEGFWHPDAGADFDHWLAGVRAAVLREAAAATFEQTMIGQKGERTKVQRPVLSADVRRWLEARADVIATSPDARLGETND